MALSSPSSIGSSSKFPILSSSIQSRSKKIQRLLMASSSPSSIGISSKFPVLSSIIQSRRQQPVVLKVKTGGGVLGFPDLKQQKSFGCSITLLQTNSWCIKRCCNGSSSSSSTSEMENEKDDGIVVIPYLKPGLEDMGSDCSESFHSDQKERLLGIIKGVWLYIVKIVSETEKSLCEYMDTVKNMYKQLMKSYEEDRDKKLKSAFSVYANSMEKEVYEGLHEAVQKFSRWLAIKLQLPFRTVFLGLIVMFCLVRTVIFALAAVVNGLFFDVPRDVLFKVIPTATMNWWKQHNIGKFFYPSPPEKPESKVQPEKTESKFQPEGEIFDAEYTQTIDVDQYTIVDTETFESDAEYTQTIDVDQYTIVDLETNDA